MDLLGAYDDDDEDIQETVQQQEPKPQPKPTYTTAQQTPLPAPDLNSIKLPPPNFDDDGDQTMTAASFG